MFQYRKRYDSARNVDEKGRLIPRMEGFNTVNGMTVHVIEKFSADISQRESCFNTVNGMTVHVIW